MKAKDVMNPHVVSINMNKSVKELVNLLSRKEVSEVPVIDDNGRLVGVVTQNDLVIGEQRLHFPPFIHILDGIVFLENTKHFEEDLRRAVASNVKDLMSTEFISVKDDVSLDEIIKIFKENDVNVIPVVDRERLVGIITRADVIKAISK